MDAQSPRTESWTSQLYNILRPAPLQSPTRKLARNRSLLRHSPGDIWKHTFSTAIYHDLSGTALEHESAGVVTWRRFVRVEHIGLSGVVFYQIRVPPSLSGLPDVNAQRYLTLENVFGDLDSPSDAGMNLDDLLDGVDAKMIYFPAYACTSFTIGQVMSSYLLEQPNHQPWPAYGGFSVCLGEFNVSTRSPPSVPHTPARMKVEEDLEESETVSHRRSFGKGLLDALSLEKDSPYISLCVRTSSLDTSDSSGTQEELESVTSTVDSAGPPTPPSSARLSQSHGKTTSYDDLLSFLDLSLDGSEG